MPALPEASPAVCPRAELVEGHAGRPARGVLGDGVRYAVAGEEYPVYEQRREVDQRFVQEELDQHHHELVKPLPMDEAAVGRRDLLEHPLEKENHDERLAHRRGRLVDDYAGDRQAGQILDPPAVGRIREDHHSEHRDQDACSRQTRAEDHAPPPGCTIYGCGQMADDGIGSDGTLVRRRAPHKASPPRSMRSGFSDPPVKDSKGTTVHVP